MNNISTGSDFVWGEVDEDYNNKNKKFLLLESSSDGPKYKYMHTQVFKVDISAPDLFSKIKGRVTKPSPSVKILIHSLYGRDQFVDIKIDKLKETLGFSEKQIREASKIPGGVEKLINLKLKETTADNEKKIKEYEIHDDALDLYVKVFSYHPDDTDKPTDQLITDIKEKLEKPASGHTPDINRKRMSRLNAEADNLEIKYEKFINKYYPPPPISYQKSFREPRGKQNLIFVGFNVPYSHNEADRKITKYKESNTKGLTLNEVNKDATQDNITKFLQSVIIDYVSKKCAEKNMIIPEEGKELMMNIIEESLSILADQALNGLEMTSEMLHEKLKTTLKEKNKSEWIDKETFNTLFSKEIQRGEIDFDNTHKEQRAIRRIEKIKEEKILIPKEISDDFVPVFEEAIEKVTDDPELPLLLINFLNRLLEDQER